MDQATTFDASARIFMDLPEGHLAFPATDTRCLPLIAPGEVAVIDVADRALQPGKLYLRRIAYSDKWSSHATLSIVEAVAGEYRGACPISGNGPAAEKTPCWYFVAHNRPARREDWGRWAKTFGPVPFWCGPHDPDYPGFHKIMESIVGRVVGILSGCEARAQPEATQLAYGPDTHVLTPL